MSTTHGTAEAVPSEAAGMEEEMSEEEVAAAEALEAELMARMQNAFVSEPTLLKGEEKTAVFEGSELMPAHSRSVAGTLYITNYRAIFYPLNVSSYDDASDAEVHLPLTCVYAVNKVNTQNAIEVVSKLGERHMLQFGSQRRRQQVFHALSTSVRESSGERMFAFVNREQDGWTGLSEQAREAYGWGLYDAEAEYERLGVSEEGSGWRVSHANAEYALCETYPRVLVVPSSVSDEELEVVAGFRSKGRLPTLVWRHPANTATLCRCSQPRVGMKRSRCAEDEKLLACMNETCVGADTLRIVDVRPRVNAVGNTVIGAGFESTSFYPNTQLDFMGIENIHVMRTSMQKLTEACQSLLATDEPYSHSTKLNGFLGAVDASNWLDHVRMVLTTAVGIASSLERGESVLVHCSDGWDRTSQVIGLAELMLDAEYRTLRGFLLLIEKEWLSFGHKFQTRCGHGAPPDDQQSPIFVQFLDCVYQLLVMQPCLFEFNENLLLCIAEHVYSCRYGTFLANCERERAELAKSTTSLWAYVYAMIGVEEEEEGGSKQQQQQQQQQQQREGTATHVFANPFYERVAEPVIPDVSASDIRLWEGFFLRHRTQMLHGDAIMRGLAMKRELLELRARVAELEGGGSGL